MYALNYTKISFFISTKFVLEFTTNILITTAKAKNYYNCTNYGHTNESKIELYTELVMKIKFQSLK